MRSLQRYATDQINITNLGGCGCGSVLHMGANVANLHQSTDTACQNFVDNLDWVLENTPESSTIFLENMAGCGTRMCCKMKEWSRFWNYYLDSDLQSRVKWCVDTAHLFATGEYNISNPDEVERFYADFDKNIGWDNLGCFHFNNSKAKCKSFHDIHADLTSGYIETAGMEALCKLATKTGKPMILETPANSQSLEEQFGLIKKWGK